MTDPQTENVAELLDASNDLINTLRDNISCGVITNQENATHDWIGHYLKCIERYDNAIGKIGWEIFEEKLIKKMLLQKANPLH